MVGIAAFAFILRLLDFPMPPLVPGFVLGGMMEENLRRALTIHDNSFSSRDWKGRIDYDVRNSAAATVSRSRKSSRSERLRSRVFER